MNGSTESRQWTSHAVWLGLIAVLLMGTGLRLAFSLISHPHVDEYSSIWAALQTLQKGVPVLPSGFIYLQGLLFTYVDAVFIGALGVSEWTARLPNLLASVLTLPLVFVWGRRTFGSWAGLIATTLTALGPASIVWGGRARMYALQQMLLVWALYAFYVGYVETRRDGQRARWRWVFAISFVGAVLSQTVTVLVAPAIILSLFVWRRRWRDERAAWVPLILFACSLPLALALHRTGGPVSDAVGRAFLDPSLPWRLKPEYFFREFFWGWPTILCTGLFLLGFVLLGMNIRRQQDHVTTALLYLYVLVSLTVWPMIFLVGESWQRPRYLTMMQPVMGVLTAGVLWYAWTFVGRCRDNRCRTALATLVWAGTLVVFLPTAINTIGPAEPAYDDAFHYVQVHWQKGDAVIGPLPSIAGTYLGRCDGYALQNGYEEYLVWQNGRPVDRWTGAPLIDSIAAFEQQFNDDRRVWFVIDDLRWQQRYTPKFRDYITQHMSVAAQVPGVTVYLRSPARTRCLPSPEDPTAATGSTGSADAQKRRNL